MSNATPDWAAFSESILANHMQQLTTELEARGFRIRRLMPNRFVSWHRERISLAMPQRRAAHVEAMLNVSVKQQSLNGRLTFTVNGAKDNHMDTVARSEELHFGAMPLNTDMAQALLEQTLKAQFTPELIAELVDQALTP